MKPQVGLETGVLGVLGAGLLYVFCLYMQTPCLLVQHMPSGAVEYVPIFNSSFATHTHTHTRTRTRAHTHTHTHAVSFPCNASSEHFCSWTKLSFDPHQVDLGTRAVIPCGLQGDTPLVAIATILATTAGSLLVLAVLLTAGASGIKPMGRSL